MNADLRTQLINTATSKIGYEDPSHDITHTLRVLSTAEKIASAENVDLDIIIPAAIFHDVINYPKNDPKSKLSSTESADYAETILLEISDYPKEKIEAVKTAITSCSFSKGIVPEQLEAKILQDADRLEATGAISIMRTFASTGKMGRPFYHTEDPFCESRTPDDLKYAVDLFYTRLLKVGEQMHTSTAKVIANRRTEFLNSFLSELEQELDESAS
jgi:uncharacterized protein